MCSEIEECYTAEKYIVLDTVGRQLVGKPSEEEEEEEEVGVNRQATVAAVNWLQCHVAYAVSYFKIYTFPETILIVKSCEESIHESRT